MDKGTIIGIDLAGPSNLSDTAVAVLEVASGRLRLIEGVGDADLLALAQGCPGPLAFGLDAPLSYQPGGGLRAGDRALRERLRDVGMMNSVMPPTLNRMVYLTLRGMTVARLLQGFPEPPDIAEVHPGGAMVLRGAAVDDVREMKRNPAARQRLVGWMAEQDLPVGQVEVASDHGVAALAALLGTRSWAAGDAAWSFAAAPPHHPYPYIC